MADGRGAADHGAPRRPRGGGPNAEDASGPGVAGPRQCPARQRAGLVDKLRLVVAPAVLGSGRRLLTHPAAASGLRLVRHDATPRGLLLLEYDVTGVAAVGDYEGVTHLR